MRDVIPTIVVSRLQVLFF